MGAKSRCFADSSPTFCYRNLTPTPFRTVSEKPSEKFRWSTNQGPTSVRNEARGPIWPSYVGKKRGPSAASTPFRTGSENIFLEI
jgi:hypothetical protein